MSSYTTYACDGPGCTITTHHNDTGFRHWLILNTPGQYTKEEDNDGYIHVDRRDRHFHHHECLTDWLTAHSQ